MLVKSTHSGFSPLHSVSQAFPDDLFDLLRDCRVQQVRLVFPAPLSSLGFIVHDFRPQSRQFFAKQPERLSLKTEWNCRDEMAERVFDCAATHGHEYALLVNEMGDLSFSAIWRVRSGSVNDSADGSVVNLCVMAQSFADY